MGAGVLLQGETVEDVHPSHPACLCFGGKGPWPLRLAGFLLSMNPRTARGAVALFRIVESLRLEKTSKIIKSNCQPIPTMPAKPCPEVPYPHVF